MIVVSSSPSNDTAVRCNDRLASIFALSIFQIDQRAVEVGVVADDDRIIRDGCRYAPDAAEKLSELRPRLREDLWPTVDDDQLLAPRSDDATT